MDYRQCIPGIVICILIFIVCSIMIFFLECLKGFRSSDADKYKRIQKISENKRIVGEREGIIKIIASAAEILTGEMFFIDLSKNILHSAAFIFITVILICIFCAVFPTMLAGKREKHSRFVYIGGAVVYYITAPLWWIQYAVGSGILVIFGAERKNDNDELTEEKILKLVDEGNENGIIKESQREMINNIFDFDETIVSDIMTHRKDMVAVSEETTIGEAVRVATKEGYSRIPVYEGNVDRITGVIYAKDLLSIIGDNKNCDVPVKKFMRKIMFVPETADCSEVLKTMLKNKTQIAIVSDEYGGTFGIVCMEDLIEEIVGNIQDEYDNEEADICKIDTNVYIIDGDAKPDDVFEELCVKMPDEDKYDTMSGFLVDLLGYVPKNDENPIMIYENIELKALEVKDNWITKIRIEILEQKV